MKHTNLIDVPAKPAYTKMEVTKVTCDLCGNKINISEYSAEEIQVSCKTGSCYPEGSGSGDLTEFDVCSQCFEKKLIPWFQSQGAEPQVSEWDY